LFIAHNYPKTGPPRKTKLSVAPLVAPFVAGPSKSKPPPAPEPPTTRTEPVKTEMKVKQASFVSISEKGKEKTNATGKLNFFAKSKDKKDVKPPEVKKVKKEESVVNLNSKMFFSKPAEKPSETTMSGASTKVEKVKKPNSVSWTESFV
jgi:hypothetical protein